MITSMAQADREMAELFRQAWEVEANLPAVYPNSNAGVPKAETWAHWGISYTGGGQRSFGPKGRRKFEKTGSVVITVFSPLGKGSSFGRDKAAIALEAYEGKSTPGGVVFRDCRIETEGEGSVDGSNSAWWATVVLAEFNYFYLR